MSKGWLVFVVAMVMTSCAGTRLVNGKVKDVSPETILSEMNAALVQCNTLSGKAQISIEAENTQQVSIDITMQTDSFIGLSFRVLGIEGARVLITPDSVRIIDRINKQYLPRDIQFFSQQFGIPADFSTCKIYCSGIRFLIQAPGILRLMNLIITCTRPVPCGKTTCFCIQPFCSGSSLFMMRQPTGTCNCGTALIRKCMALRSP
jgi:hypothetical protein